MLRHTFRAIAANVGVDELLVHFPVGHAPKGISVRRVLES